MLIIENIFFESYLFPKNTISFKLIDLEYHRNSILSKNVNQTGKLVNQSFLTCLEITPSSKHGSNRIFIRFSIIIL
jgi:hypothetical protein